MLNNKQFSSVQPMAFEWPLGAYNASNRANIRSTSSADDAVLDILLFLLSDVF